MKHVKRIFCMALTICFAFCCSLTALASDSTASIYDTETGKRVAEETTISLHTPQIARIPQHISSEEQFVQYALHSEKKFVQPESSVDLSELLKESTNVVSLSNGNKTGTFQSAKMETGTPGVYWYYTIDYEIEPFANGYGWRFVSAPTTVYYEKTFEVNTWATVCLVDITSATYSLNSDRTSVTVSISLDFNVYSDPFPSGIKYSESHTHTTTIANLGP